ncbi:glycosyltransferase family 4 protein [Coprococcus sp. B2-R-112]|uniref:glycosyltransferase family 4 protein n=1 Tax=Coprococcus sp. B2-R-112 TaxID=2949662 RepID=UPI00202E44FD|nr:glycosyltransferase family 4 protein [Coprococcus sp. B2-R-112]MCM0662956.1 glycosyltransferase family 4 protein [Coprococcus sp. B2-R-112]
MVNYLISAYSVNPYKGSEDSIGWNWVLQYEKNYKEGDRIILLTKKFNEKDTRRGLKEFNIQHVELVIVDVPNALNWFREKHSAFHHMYYILWQHWAWLWVKHSGIRFDVIHHVTMNDYRIPSELYKAKGAKVIWGPMGGAQVTPRPLKVYEKNQLVASFREFVNKSCSWNPFYKKALRSYYKIYCINNETQKQISRIVGKDVPLMPELALRDEYKNLPIRKGNNDILKIVFVGRLIGKKGIAFLVDALSLMPTDMNWELLIFGDGDDRALIEKQIADSGVGKNVKLMGNRPLNQIAEAYQQADVFVLPSLRETSGNVLLEAMAYAVPIVAFDTSFCRLLKEVDCGVFVNTDQALEGIKEDWCKAIVTLGQDKELAKQMGLNGYKYVNSKLTWDEKYRIIVNDM